MKLLLGDCITRMRELPMESIDCIITDPPYALNFMGKEWDRPRMQGHVERGTSSRAVPDTKGAHDRGYAEMRGHEHEFQMWCTQWGKETLYALKPGGHLLAFGGTRTYHRLVAGLEDAGFEVRDCMMWLYGSGFPKSLNLPGGLGTALKPAWEPIVVVRKPLDGTVENNVTSYGTGALNIDAARVGTSKSVPASPRRATQNAAFGALSNDPGTGSGWDENIGRWPANLVLTHHDECVLAGQATAPGRKMNRYVDGLKPFGGGKGHASTQETMPDEQIEVWECHPDCPVRIMDEQSGERPSGGKVKGTEASRTGQNGIYGTYQRVENHPFGDIGGASRFFYCAKTSPAERNAGVDGGSEYTERDNGFSSKISNTKNPRGNDHPTVKPIELMRYLIRLACPLDGVVLDCFMGSGTTGAAALLEKRTFIGIEREKDYMKIAKQRIQYWQQHGEDGWRIAAEREAGENRRERVRETGQLELL